METGWAFIIALAPIVTVLLALMARIAALWAGITGVIIAGAGTLLAFPLTWPTVQTAADTMGPTFITVAFILLGGVGLAELTYRSGAQNVIATWLGNAHSGVDEVTVVALITFGVTPFMESVTGFGLGVVITAPLLIRLGFTPARAVTTGLLGLVLVPWGSLAPGTLVAADLGGVDFKDLGIMTAVLTLPLLIVNVTAVMWLNYRRVWRHHLRLLGVIISVEWLVLIGANAAIGPPLAGVLASAAVIGVVVLWIRRRSGSFPGAPHGLARALLPYSILTLGLLTSGIAAQLTGNAVILVLANPALWLIASVLITVLTIRLTQPTLSLDAPRLFTDTVVRWQPVASITLLFMLLGALMSANGMAAQLATSAASMGSVFLVFVPMIGALGGYLTGSNTGAAAMFSTATTTAATNVGTSPLIALAAQNVAGSAAIIASPPRVAFAASVAYNPGQQLPRTAHHTLVSAVGASVIILALAMPILAAVA